MGLLISYRVSAAQCLRSRLRTQKLSSMRLRHAPYGALWLFPSTSGGVPLECRGVAQCLRSRLRTQKLSSMRPLRAPQGSTLAVPLHVWRCRRRTGCALMNVRTGRSERRKERVRSRPVRSRTRSRAVGFHGHRREHGMNRSRQV